MIKQKIKNYVSDHIDDDYAMDVLYYAVKTAVVERDFDLRNIRYFEIDGRFLGEPYRVNTNARYVTTIDSLSLVLSLRALKINKELLEKCKYDSLIFISERTYFYQWVDYASIILDCAEDEEFRKLFEMIRHSNVENCLTDEQKEWFRKSCVKPEYKHIKVFYERIASENQGIKGEVICDNAFVYEPISSYEVSEDVQYIGNTAFAYCQNLSSIRFYGKVLFGKFPIIECDNLQTIIVPNDLVDYYKQELPFYEKIIMTLEQAEADAADETDEESNECETEAEQPVEKPVEHTINPELLKKVFDNVSSSYKFFWFRAIVSLAKESECMAISFKDILIRMAAYAWPLIFTDGLDFGKIDKIGDYLGKIMKNTQLIPLATSNVVNNHLQQCYESKRIDKILKPLLNNVPYRFLSPWIKFTTNEDVVEKSKKKDFTGPYALFDNYLILDEDWWDYMNENYQKVCEFTKSSFIQYLKKYNSDMKLLRLKTMAWDDN